MSVTPSQFDLLKTSINALSLRHKVVSQNIANVNTPGYRAQHVLFEQALGRQLSAGQPLDRIQEPVVEEDASRAARLDGNTVDIDLEMTSLEKNAMLFEAYTELLSSKISMMRSAISGR